MEQYTARSIVYTETKDRLKTASNRNKKLSIVRPKGYRYSHIYNYSSIAQKDGTREVTEVITFEKE